MEEGGEGLRSVAMGDQVGILEEQMLQSSYRRDNILLIQKKGGGSSGVLWVPYGRLLYRRNGFQKVLGGEPVERKGTFSGVSAQRFIGGKDRILTESRKDKNRKGHGAGG